MKKKSKNFIYLFLLMGLLIFFTNSCKKDDIPTLTTKSITSITQSSAICGGDITFDGNSSVIARGVCWSTNTNPTVSDSKTIDGSGTGSFVSTINGLSSNTTYYVKAYATNSFGTAYGNVVSFTTLDTTLTDSRDGKVYKTIKIGTQTWMAENLAFLPSVSPPSEFSLTSPFYYVYGYNGNVVANAKATTNYSIYGVLYNWPAAMNGASSSSANPSGIQGICPNGWHLPSDAEWTQLSNYLGGEEVAGGKLKESGTIHWTAPNNGATNETFFTGLPGGYRNYNGTFVNINNFGIWWSSTDLDSDLAYRFNLYCFGTELNKYDLTKEVGVSVRCVMD